MNTLPLKNHNTLNTDHITGHPNLFVLEFLSVWIDFHIESLVPSIPVSKFV